jgi:hypothetical protein
MTDRIPVTRWPAYAFIAFLVTTLVLMGAWHASAKKATVSWIGGQPTHYAAAHRGHGRIDWERGAVVRLTKGNRSVVVRFVDFCEGSTCQDADISKTAFSILGSPGQGLMRVDVGCGRRGTRPMRECVR